MSSAVHGIRLCDRCNHTFAAAGPLRSPELTTTLNQLRAHYSPNYSETQRIAHLLLEAELQLEKHDTEIDRLEAALLKLRSQRAHVQKNVDVCRGFHAPIRRIPSEVLAEVFAHCQPQWPGRSPQVEHSGTDEPVGFMAATLTLGLVCARWRDIILSAKELWSTVIVDVNVNISVTDEVGYAKFLAVHAMLHLYIQRSGNVPLTISVSVKHLLISSRAPVRNDTSGKAICDTLASQAYRWRRARIILDDDDGLVSFWSDIQGSLPELEELSIRDIDSLAGITCIAPKLHTLTLYNYYDEDFGERMASPWNHIRVLRCDGQFVHFISAAKRCSQITSLEINTGLLQFVGVVKHLRCDSLEHLSLQANSWMDEDEPFENALIGFFDRLTLPCLKSLSIGLPLTHGPGPYAQSSWPLEAFTSFLSRSSCFLNALSLKNIKIAADELLSMLHLTPALTSLNIHEIPVQGTEPCPLVTDELLRSLTHFPHTSNANITLPVPRLTHLELRAAPFFNDQALLNMIESRWLPQSVHSHESGGVACLESVDVSFMKQAFKFKEPICLSGLRELGKQGLAVMLDPVVYDRPPCTFIL